MHTTRSWPHRFERLLERIADHIQPLIVTTGLMMLAAYLIAMVAVPRPNGRAVFGDATHHFVQLRSLLFDRDLDFQNEYVRLYHLSEETPETAWIFSQRTATGHVRNYMPVGPALLWAPLYGAMSLAGLVVFWLGLGPRPDGFEFVLQLSTGATGVIAATVAAWLSWRLARHYSAPTSASSATIAVWLGSHAIYYSFISPTYSHAASMLTSALFFTAWLQQRATPSLKSFAGWGALAGASALMRWQDAIFLLVPMIDAVRWREPWRRRAVAVAIAGGAWLLVFSPQMAIWHVLYGQALAVPQGPAFMRWLSPHPVDVLFSSYHGLFTWAPVLVPAVIGLIWFTRRTPGLAVPLGVLFLLSWYVNASVADWWAGEAYGARRFLSLFPLFVLGAAVWLEPAASTSPMRTGRHLALFLLTGLNGLLLLQYQLFMKGLSAIAPYPGGWFDMWLTRFIVPFRLAARWFAIG